MFEYRYFGSQPLEVEGLTPQDENFRDDHHVRVFYFSVVHASSNSDVASQAEEVAEESHGRGGGASCVQTQMLLLMQNRLLRNLTAEVAEANMVLQLRQKKMKTNATYQVLAPI